MKYNLGSGPNKLPGYVNVDNYSHCSDLKADVLTMKYDRCDEIVTRHMFEHFGYPESFALLVKWTTALVVGGKLIIEVPDVRAIIGHTNGDIKCEASAMRLIYGSQEAAWAEHINGWTPVWTHHVLTQFGYVDITDKHMVSGGDLFPNCSYEVTAKKDLDISRDQLVDTSRILLGYYCHSSETLLHRYYYEKMRRFV